MHNLNRTYPKYREWFVRDFNRFLNFRHSINLSPDPLGPVTPDYYDWSSTDNEEDFKDNLAKYGRRHLQFYLNNPIKYYVNSSYYRSKHEYEKDTNLKVDLYLGCSHTFGVGHHYDNIWTSQVAKYTGNHQINLGAGGHGVELCYINLKKYINYYDVQNVFMYMEIVPRYHVFDGEVHSVFRPTAELDETKNWLHFKNYHIEKALMDDGYMDFRYSAHIDAIENVCNRKGINFYYCYTYPNLVNSADKWGIELGFDYGDDIPARDLRHYSVACHKLIADKFIKKYDEGEGYVELPRE